jgi:hypothetical protein
LGFTGGQRLEHHPETVALLTNSYKALVPPYGAVLLRVSE